MGTRVTGVLLLVAVLALEGCKKAASPTEPMAPTATPGPAASPTPIMGGGGGGSTYSPTPGAFFGPDDSATPGP